MYSSVFTSLVQVDILLAVMGVIWEELSHQTISLLETDAQCIVQCLLYTFVVRDRLGVCPPTRADRDSDSGPDDRRQHAGP